MKNYEKHKVTNQHYRWGLTVALFAAVGFSLSMNPQHFNNIARVYKNAEFANYASSGDEYTIVVGDTTFIANVTIPRNLTEGDYTRIVKWSAASNDQSETEAKCLGLCGQILPLKPTGEGVAEIEAALKAFVEARKTAVAAKPKEEAKEEKKEPADEAEKALADANALIDKSKEKCEALEEDAKLRCFVKEIGSLSKIFAKDKKFKKLKGRGAELLTALYKDELKPSFEAGLKKKIQYTRDQLNELSDSGLYLSRDELQDVFEETDFGSTLSLISDLNETLSAVNGGGIRRDMMALERKGILNQTQYAQKLVQKGVKESDPIAYRQGYWDLNSLGSLSQSRVNYWADSIEGVPDYTTKIGNRMFSDFDSIYYTPSNRFFSEILRNYASFGDVNLANLSTQADSANPINVANLLRKVGNRSVVEGFRLPNDGIYKTLTGRMDQYAPVSSGSNVPTTTLNQLSARGLQLPPSWNASSRTGSSRVH